jgi:competence CoiA-like predicted nuclease
MDFAKDRRGNIVRASEAMTGVLGYYFCPVCKAEVFARQGEYYVHHFAHRARRARPECEL